MLNHMKKNPSTPHSQRGMTLIELLVAGVISLIAAAGMIAVMANTLGTGTQTIKMTKLTQEMRTAMQIMSRELRRANFHASYMSCFGNMGCRDTLGIAAKINTINIIDVGAAGSESDCFWFWYDRPQAGTPIAVNSEPVAAFRRTTEAVGGVNIGKLQMTITETDMVNCNPNAAWVDITDPELVDITAFDVSDAASVLEVIDPVANTTQSVERIALDITARLTPDTSVPAWLQTGTNLNAARDLQEFITVRNHTTAAP